MGELAVRTFEENAHRPNHRDVELRESLALSNSTCELGRKLDQALMDTFPASDPVSIVICARDLINAARHDGELKCLPSLQRTHIEEA
jgi:hypothetical protein